jgi:hypothetical protein
MSSEYNILLETCRQVPWAKYTNTGSIGDVAWSIMHSCVCGGDI